jgi:hypothetical protein
MARTEPAPVRVRARALDDRLVVSTTPRRSLVLRPLFIAGLWAALTATVVLALIRGQRAFLFLPIILLPVKGFYRALTAVVNRVDLALSRQRFVVEQGPLPQGEARAFATRKIRVFRASARAEAVGGWLTLGEKLEWTVKVLFHEGGGDTLDLALPSKEVASEVAEHLNSELERLRTRTTYRS